MTRASLAVVVLAAGKGTRMRSALPKVLHPVGGTPMIERVVATARQLTERVVVVTAADGEPVRGALEGLGVDFAVQADQRGTGDAVAAAMDRVADAQQVLILCGDVPLLTVDTLIRLVDETPADGVGLVTARVPDPAGLGRILRDGSGAIHAVVEEGDATAEQRLIDEINSGIYLLPGDRLGAWLDGLSADNAQGEYYLTDVIAAAVAEQRPVAGVDCADLAEITGINDRIQLADAERQLRQRQAERLMRGGVSLLDPARIDVRGQLSAGEDCSIDVNCVFSGTVTLGRGVRIGAHCVIGNAVIEDEAVIHPFTHIDGARVGPGASVGPFARLRQGTDLGPNTRIGNFVETKQARLGPGSKANHLAYLGDATLGADCNVGAGTITCNYDGEDKHPTRMGDRVFIGSNATLVAPLELADGAYVAAGSTITAAVPADALGVGRARQRNIESWKRPRKRGNRE